MSLPKYPEYKDSGVEWLGPVPAHWNMQRLKYTCTVFPSNVDKHSRDGEPAVRLCNYTDVYYNERITSSMPFMEATASADQIFKFTLKAGDTIITKDSETADDIAIAAYVPEDLPGVVCGYHLSMVRPRKGTSGAFVKRLFDSVYAKARFAVSANGLTRVGLGQYALDNVEFPFPPVHEQAAIAAFLDRETAKIDALIAEQEKLIALLAEKRQATISHAVTRGLNPDAPMKDSGVEWLGQVPAHWEVSPLKRFLADIKAGPFGSALTKDMYVGNGYRVYGQEQVIPGDFSIGDYYIDDNKFQELRQYSVQAGDVLISCVGTFGKIAIVPSEAEPGIINPRLIRIRVGEAISARYIESVLRSSIVFEQFSMVSRGGTMDTINIGTLNSIAIAVPPIEEQESLLSFLDIELERIDALTSDASKTVNLLSERRAALIAAAVAGQIDVRGLVHAPATEAETA